MQFVNINGNPWNPSAAAVEKPKKAQAEKVEKLKGYNVRGFSPDDIAKAKECHDKDAADLKDRGRSVVAFDAEAYMRSH